MFDIEFDKLDKSKFLKEYWQKKPCFFKNAFPDYPSYISADELAGLSLEEEIESRIVQFHSGSEKWSLQHGPFNEAQFSKLPESDWTLLVQSIDAWCPDARQLLSYFNFIPRWRLDDIMVSYATHNGGVGPHADNYDVFLIQGQGERHWRVGKKGDTTKHKNIIGGMIHLEEFEPIIDEIMQPGDMLYIPPDTPHWGISIGESIGYSVGYRSMQTNQMLALITEHLADKIDYQQFFSDQYRSAPNYTNQFEPQVLDWAQKELVKLSNNSELLSELLAKHLSYSKLGVELTSNNLDLAASKKSYLVQLNEDLTVTWRTSDDKIILYIEGEVFNFEIDQYQLVNNLASFKSVEVTKNTSLSERTNNDLDKLLASGLVNVCHRK